MAVKAAIGIVISIVGMDYRSLKQSLSELQNSKYSLSTELAVMTVELKELISRLERMEHKIDKVSDR